MQVIKSKSKSVAVLESRNFLVSILSILFLVMAYMGADVSEGAAETITDSILSGNLTAILMAIFTNFLNPLMRIIAKAKEKGGIDFGFVKSINFWVQTGTVLAMLLGTIGLVFPDNFISETIGAIQSGDIGLILLALIANVINPIIHFFKDKKQPQPQL